jgi:hypothetical protein
MGRFCSFQRSQVHLAAGCGLIRFGAVPFFLSFESGRL